LCALVRCVDNEQGIHESASVALSRCSPGLGQRTLALVVLVRLDLLCLGLLLWLFVGGLDDRDRARQHPSPGLLAHICGAAAFCFLDWPSLYSFMAKCRNGSAQPGFEFKLTEILVAGFEEMLQHHAGTCGLHLALLICRANHDFVDRHMTWRVTTVSSRSVALGASSVQLLAYKRHRGVFV
jgi:hypothetical protein